jgi:transposase
LTVKPRRIEPRRRAYASSRPTTSATTSAHRRCAGSLPAVDWLIADRGYDADCFRDALQDKGIRPCIPGRRSREKAAPYDKRRYKRRNRIEIMFGRLKDWRLIATRYDRCPKIFLSAIALAATVIF